MKCHKCGQAVERARPNRIATCFDCKREAMNANRHKYKRTQGKRNKEVITERRSWEEIKRIKHGYRVGWDRDYLLKKYPDISYYIELEDFVLRLKSNPRKLFAFENMYAEQVNQMLSE